MLITLNIFTTLGNIILFLFVLGLVICIHELGHFLFAKKAGILCHEFAFGMGPRLWSKKKGETIFSIRAIPFGGFVSMAGEEIESEVVKLNQSIRVGFNKSNEIDKIIIDVDNPIYKDYLLVVVDSFDLSSEDGTRLYINDYTVNRKAMYYMPKKNVIQIAPKDRTFTNKTKTQRFLTTFGGPLMNFVLALVIFFIMSLIAGVPDPDSTVIGNIGEGMPVSEILEKGDKIISINDVPVYTWSGENNSISSELAKSDTYTIKIERDGEVLEFSNISPQMIFYGLGFTSTIGSDELIIGTPLYLETELLSGDKIISIDGETFNTWEDVIVFAQNYKDGSTEDNPTEIVVERDGELLTFTYVAYGEDVISALGYETYFSRIGITGSNKFSFFGSFAGAWNSFTNASGMIFKTLGLLFSSSQVGVGDLSGFIGIFSMTSQAAAAGLVSLLSWIGLLSVNLCIVNLLQIRALDGGRLVFIGYEAVTGIRPNQKVENTLHTIMFFLLMALLIFITYNDIIRLFK